MRLTGVVVLSVIVYHIRHSNGPIGAGCASRLIAKDPASRRKSLIPIRRRVPDVGHAACPLPSAGPETRSVRATLRDDHE